MERLTIHTPENVRLNYDVAGLGSRFFALFLDNMIQNILLVAFTTPFHHWKLSSLADLPQKIDGLSSLYLSLLAIFLFLITFGYFIFFETFWDGQTPGKKLFGLKVRRTGGHPLDIFGAFLRNILRMADFLPFMYLAGFITMFLNPSGRRIGDLVAGTIVIREGRRKLPEPLRLTSEPHEEQRRRNLGGSLPLNIDQQMRGVREYFRRRNKMAPSAKDRLAAALLKSVFPDFIDNNPQLKPGEAEIYLAVLHRWFEQERVNRLM